MFVFNVIILTFLAQLAGSLEYTDYIYAEEYDSLKECPDNMTLNNLVVRLQ